MLSERVAAAYGPPSGFLLLPDSASDFFSALRSGVVRFELRASFPLGTAMQGAGISPAGRVCAVFGIGHFFRALLGLVFCLRTVWCRAFGVVCLTLSNRNCYARSKLQPCGQSLCSFWHKPFFANFGRFAFLPAHGLVSCVLSCMGAAMCRSASAICGLSLLLLPFLLWDFVPLRSSPS